MSTIITPWLRSPLTDLTSGLVNHQWFGRCQEMEMNMIDCLEAYGVDRGMQKCEALINDFNECHFRYKQLSRVQDMRRERARQYWMGERTKENRYAPGPSADSY